MLIRQHEPGQLRRPSQLTLLPQHLLKNRNEINECSQTSTFHDGKIAKRQQRIPTLPKRQEGHFQNQFKFFPSSSPFLSLAVQFCAKQLLYLQHMLY